MTNRIIHGCLNKPHRERYLHYRDWQDSQQSINRIESRIIIQASEIALAVPSSNLDNARQAFRSNNDVSGGGVVTRMLNHANQVLKVLPIVANISTQTSAHGSV